MKELVFHRVFLPAVDATPTRWLSTTATTTPPSPSTATGCCAWPTRCGASSVSCPADRFAVMAANSHEFLELYHAAFLGAGVINPLNLRLARPRSCSTSWRDSGTRVLFVDALFADHFVRAVGDVRDELALERIVVLIGDGDVPHDVALRGPLSRQARRWCPTSPRRTTPSCSCTRAAPRACRRACCSTSRAEMLNLYHIAMALDFDERRVYLHQTPMFHAASMGGVLGIPAIGATSVVHPDVRPARRDGVDRAPRGRPGPMMVPTMIAMVLNHPDFRPDRLASLRDLVYGASPMSSALLERLMRELPATRHLAGLRHDRVLVGAHLPRPPTTTAGRRRAALGGSCRSPAWSCRIQDAEGDVSCRGRDR